MASAAATSPSSRAATLALLRSFLRTSARFSDYNIREYARRRALDGFRQKRGLSDPSAILSALSEGETLLEVARRQALVYGIYAPKVKNFMEIKHVHHH